MIEDKASRYHRLKRRASVLSLSTRASILVLLLLTGGSQALSRAVAIDLPARFAPAMTVVAFATVLLLLVELATLPFAFYSGFLLERRYGLSTQTLGGWLADEMKGLGLGWIVSVAAASVVYGLIRQAPAFWWLPTGAVFALLIVGLANLGPVLLLPLFYPVRPLAREALEVRLLSLAERAGARVLGVYELGLSAQTRKANAALAGLGSTRRILVSDTMLADYSDDEIEVVLAHELAHHVHGDIWQGLLFESGLLLLGAYASFRLLPWGVQAFGLDGLADVAGLPLLVLAAGLIFLAVAPVAHALSRANERRADRFALRLTNNPAAFISAMKRLGAQNLAEDEPSKIVQWLFYSHPPIRERIAVARGFVA